MAAAVASAAGGGGAGRATRRPLRRGTVPGRKKSFPAGLSRRLLRSAAGWGAATAAAIGVALLVRRLSGGLAAPAGAAALAAVTAAGIGLAALADRVRRHDVAPRFASRLGLALAMAALCPPFTGPAVPLGHRLAAVVLLVAGTAALLAPLRGVRAPTPAPRPRRAARPARDGRRGGRKRAERPDAGVGETGRAIPLPDPGRDPLPAPPPPLAAVPAPPAVPEPGTILLQRFERWVRGEDRAEIVRGTILLHVAAGSRAAVGHVGFCPPFRHVPRVEVGTSCEEIEATVVAAEVLPWGVRVECRLDEAADASVDVPVDVLATSTIAPPAEPPPP